MHALHPHSDPPALLICDVSGGVVHASTGARAHFGPGARGRVCELITRARRSGAPSLHAEIDGVRCVVRQLDGPCELFALVVSPPPADAHLSPRQREVARYACAGATAREIASHLGISPHTVRQHLKEVYRLLEVGSRVELARALNAA